MKHRTHDHLFAAAGVTAALSLIGTGATVLRGSVFHFDRWPLVAGDSARNVQLPTAPIPADEPATQSARQALLAGATRVGGTEALLPGLGGHTGISSIGVTIPAPIATGTGGAGGAPVGATTTGGGASSPSSSSVAGATQDGFGFSLGSAPSSSVDGSRSPAGPAAAPTSTTRVASGAVDTDGDGIPDTWQKDHGAPATSDAPATTGTTTTDGRDPTTASAFTAVPPATPTPDPTATTPVGTPPATQPSTDPAKTDPSTGTPAPTPTPPATTPAPADPAPAPDAQPTTPPSDPAPAPVATPPATPAPADPTPPADPAPAPAPTPAPAAAPAPAPTPAPAEAAPPAAETAPAAAAANAAIPAGVQ
jgi:hypothetical protein